MGQGSLPLGFKNDIDTSFDFAILMLVTDGLQHRLG